MESKITSSKLNFRTITTGKAYDLKSNLVSDNYTLFYFSASWCPFCQALEQEMEKKLAGRKDVAIRKIEIVNWDSEAANQAGNEFGLEKVPYVRIHGPDGAFLGHVQGNNIAEVEALITQKAPKGTGSK